jgi:hypothetical protein
MSQVHRAVSVSLKRTREQKFKAANNRVRVHTDSQQPQLKRKTVAAVVQHSLQILDWTKE